MVSPLVVDLDGTLIRTDLLFESALRFIRTGPLRIFLLFYWLFQGKAFLKQRLAEAVNPLPELLPYDQRVLDYIEGERAAGRRIILATASHSLYAHAVAEYLGLFDEVMATEGKCNLSAKTKRDALIEAFGEKGFDYMGNAHGDIPVWVAAEKAVVVNPSPGLTARAEKTGNVVLVLKKEASFFSVWPKALRLHQWVKNFLIFVPLLASHRMLEPGLFLQALLAFFCFGLCASSVYLLNDMLDLEEDRRHPSKRMRPFASGALSLSMGFAVFPLLLLISFLLSFLFLPIAFLFALVAYYSLTLAYSFGLKRLVLVDVFTLALLYTLRLVAGALSVDVALTFWILAFSMFIFLSLALVKRYAELHLNLENNGGGKPLGRGYHTEDMGLLLVMGVVAGYLCVLVLALYIQDEATSKLYARPEWIWSACILLLFWISRIWLLSHRGEMHDDPVVFAVRDKISLAVGFLLGLIFWMAL
ncbi:UbiA family prenyltransferase [Desulfobotulus mexicanus]|uniref:UbiA family prenyltransferase n=1 Tax=Desulfobotulus mexicanus TaxID=2586642 RepID=A0A5Q4VI73_9BACT|nr:UbiA family prenyltransferase [Desulfobotulus mexicanus]TYT75947.1 UbiA family prenyltransferase [Desulfobotulus mexicanus]